MSRFIVFCIVSAIVTAAFWLSGFNFNERGLTAVMWLVCCLLFGLWVTAYPGKFPGEKK